MDARRCASVRILIDGYNLLHQSPALGNARSRSWLAQARKRLLDHLACILSQSQCAQTIVVFDASRSNSADMADEIVQGIYVTYAAPGQEADDIVERIVRQHPTPRLLTVVSSDHRLQRCARARRALAVDSDIWLDSMHSAVQLPDSLPSDIKPNVDAQTVAEFMQEFGFRCLPPKIVLPPTIVRPEPDQENRGPSANRHTSNSQFPQSVDSSANAKASNKRPRTRRIPSLEDRLRAQQCIDNVVPDIDEFAEPQ